MGGGSLREMVELGGSTVFSCSYLFFTETVFALFFSTVWIKCYFRPQGLVSFVMKDSRVTFKGKTSPGGRKRKSEGTGFGSLSLSPQSLSSF